VALVVPIFDGLNPLPTSKTALGPWRGQSSSNNGSMRAFSAGQVSDPNFPPNLPARYRLQTNDNRVVGDYYVNTFDNPDTLTTRMQVESPRDVIRNGQSVKMAWLGLERYFVIQFVHNWPPLSMPTQVPPPYDPRATGYANFFTTYGPPYGGSSGNAIGTQNTPDGKEIMLKNRGWAKVAPRNRLITLILHRKFSTAVDRVDGYDRLWMGLDGQPAAPQIFPNGTDKSSLYANIRSGINSDPIGNEIHISNYHRAYMPTWDGIHYIEFTHFKVYDWRDVIPSVAAIDPGDSVVVAPLTAAFNRSPSAPKVGQLVTLDSSPSVGSIVTRTWNVS
jgi:hypothetical protein